MAYQTRSVEIIPREAWGATLPNRAKAVPRVILPTERKGVVLHHLTADPEKSPGIDTSDTFAVQQEHEYRLIKGVQDWHMGNNGWSDAAYSFVVGQTGTIFSMRGLLWNQFANGKDDVGHDDGNDSKWYTILWLGGGVEKPTGQALESIKYLVALLRLAGAGKSVKPHNQFKNKPCPGIDLTIFADDIDELDMEVTSIYPPSAMYIPVTPTQSEDIAYLSLFLKFYLPFIDDPIKVQGRGTYSLLDALQLWRASSGLVRRSYPNFIWTKDERAKAIENWREANKSSTLNLRNPIKKDDNPMSNVPPPLPITGGPKVTPQPIKTGPSDIRQVRAAIISLTSKVSDQSSRINGIRKRLEAVGDRMESGISTARNALGKANSAMESALGAWETAQVNREAIQDLEASVSQLRVELVEVNDELYDANVVIANLVNDPNSEPGNSSMFNKRLMDVEIVIEKIRNI